MLRPFLEFNKTKTRREIPLSSETLALTDEYNKAFFIYLSLKNYYFQKLKKKFISRPSPITTCYMKLWPAQN